MGILGLVIFTFLQTITPVQPLQSQPNLIYDVILVILLSK